MIPHPALPVPNLPSPTWLAKSRLLDLSLLIWCQRTLALTAYYEPILTTPAYRLVKSIQAENDLALRWPEHPSNPTYRRASPVVMDAHTKHATKYPYLVLTVLMCHRFKVPQFLQLDAANADNEAHRAHLRDSLQSMKSRRLNLHRSGIPYVRQPATDLQALRDLTPPLSETLKRKQASLDLADYTTPRSTEIDVWRAL